MTGAGVFGTAALNCAGLVSRGTGSEAANGNRVLQDRYAGAASPDEGIKLEQ